MKQYSANLAKGKEIIEYYVNELQSQGVTNIPMWIEPPSTISSGQTLPSTSPLTSTQDESSLINARRRLSTHESSNYLTSSSPPRASAMPMTTASNFSTLSDELESIQIGEHFQDRQGKITKRNY